MKLYSLRLRIVMPALVIFTVCLTISTWLTYRATRRAMEQTATRQMELLANASVKSIAAWVDERERDVRSWVDLAPVTAAVRAANAGEPPPPVIGSLLADIAKDAGCYETILLVDRKGLAVSSSAPDQSRGLDISERDYFQKAMQGKLVLSEVIKSKATGNPVLAIAAPVLVDGRPAGVILGALDLKGFSREFIEPVQIGQEGYAFACDARGGIFSHPDSSLVMARKLADFSFGPDIMRIRNGVLRYNYKGQDIVSAFRTDDRYGWIMIMRAKYDELMISAVEIRDLNIVVGCVTIAAVILFLYITSGAITRPITHLDEVTQLIAQGRLGEASRRLADRGFQARRDETGTLLESVSAMTRGLASLVGQVQQSGTQMISTATEIAATSHDQDALISELGASTTHVVAAVKEISATSQELAGNVRQVAKVADSTAGVAEQSRGEIVGLEAVMRALVESTGALSSKLGLLSEKSANISTVVTTMTKVADQTNLLSLNAAIEAEKAGEFGRGFAVVAQEISRLANQSAVATTEISVTVEEIQAAIRGGVGEMERFSGEVKKSVETVAKIAEKLATVIQEVQALSPRFDGVVDSVQSQAAAAGQISSAMTQLADTARLAGGAVAGLKQVSDRLLGAAQALQTEISRFRM